MTPRFAIYYADGNVEEGGGDGDEFVDVTVRVSRDWIESRSDGVIGVVSERVDGSRSGVLRGTKSHGGELALHGTEFYYPVEGGEYGFADDLGAWLGKLHPDWGGLRGSVKRGEYVSSEVMAAFWEWARGYDRIPSPRAKK